MKNISLVLLCAFMFLNANSQNSSKKNSSVNFNTDGFTGNLRSSGIWVPATPIVNEIKGSVYLFPDYTGIYKLITKNGTSLNLLNLNYNVKTKTLESFFSKDSVFQYELNQLSYVLNNNNKYRVNSDGNLKGLSLEIYNSEKIQLFKYFSVIKEKAVVNPMTNAIISDAEYTRKFVYYLYINGKETTIKLNKSDVLRVLSDKKNAVKDYVNSNKLSYSNEDDFCKILKYYESI
jgi:hypothetical protein